MVNLCRVTSTGILQLTHAQKKRRLVATRSITIKMKIKTHMASVVNVATKINKSRKENVKKEANSLFLFGETFLSAYTTYWLYTNVIHVGLDIHFGRGKVKSLQDQRLMLNLMRSLP